MRIRSAKLNDAPSFARLECDNAVKRSQESEIERESDFAIMHFRSELEQPQMRAISHEAT